MAKRNKLSLKKKVSIVTAAVLVGGFLFLRAQYVVPVLMYHSVDEKAKETKLSVCPASFEEQMKFLSEHKYNVITLQELADTVKKGRGFPSRTVAITFDDGYENNYTCVFPVIKKLYCNGIESQILIFFATIYMVEPHQIQIPLLVLMKALRIRRKP